MPWMPEGTGQTGGNDRTGYRNGEEKEDPLRL